MSRSYSLFYLSKKKKWLYLSEPKKIIVYYSHFKIDLLADKKSKTTKKEIFQKFDEYQVISKTQEHSPFVWHLTYELGYFFNDQDHLIAHDDILAIEIEFTKSEILDHIPVAKNEKCLFKKRRNISFNRYQSDFKKGLKHLLDGNCYQFNLTYHHEYDFKEHLEPLACLNKMVKSRSFHLGAFAHLTEIPQLQFSLLSNSPECLFSLDKKEQEIWSMPIKGTLSLLNFYSKEKAWDCLRSSLKDQAELNMITDLIRNDLSKIGRNYSTVVSKNSPLFVPKIVHQYSLVKVKIERDATLLSILSALFPGGSITGAPKKRVMEILKIIEKRSRRFYTGSTILGIQGNLQASINIRTLEFDFNRKIASYGAGGGITLKSNPKSEFEEMKLKVESFFDHLN